MLYKHDKNRSAEYLRLAIPHMSKQAAPVDPVSYAVWYEHVSGENPELSAAISDLLERGQVLDEETTRNLYQRYIAEPGLESLSRLRQEMLRIAGDLNGTARTASDRTGEFTTTLTDCQQALRQEAGAARLEQLINTLVDETTSLQGSIALMQGQLSSSLRETESLRRELERVRREAVTDPLTGVLNRKGFDEALAGELEQARAAGRPLCLAMLDLDHFKEINDRYGHLLGDKVLRCLAQVLKENVKGRDTVGRFGGEEFALLLRDTDMEGARVVTEQIRSQLQRARIRRLDNGQTIDQVTLSAGLARYRTGETAEELLERADALLYQAKQAGRNQVVTEG
ncbi:MAG: GGDEF domain-containing protein, partial [Gammaproteobacteria bacterium]